MSNLGVSPSARPRSIRLLATGKSNSELATTSSWERHHQDPCSNLLTKLGLRDRMQAVIFAYEAADRTGTASRLAGLSGGRNSVASTAGRWKEYPLADPDRRTDPYWSRTRTCRHRFGDNSKMEVTLRTPCPGYDVRV